MRLAHRSLLPLSLVIPALIATGCQTPPLPTGGELPDLSFAPDLATADLAARDLRAADLATPPDLATLPDLGCAPESDAAFCARLLKSCDAVTGNDNCGHSRSVNCGSCGAAQACLANVCVIPACSHRFGANGTVVSTVSVSGVQEALLGASASGSSLLFLRGPANTCVGANGQLLLADQLAPGVGDYTTRDLTTLATLGAFARSEETMTLTADGLTVIGASASFGSFLQTTRSALNATDFAPADSGPFAQLNAALPTAQWIGWPVISADGLAFYYRVTGAADASLDGNYESVRSATNVPFPAGQRLPAAVQAWDGISGVSTDRLTLFVTRGFGTSLMARTSWSQPFSDVTDGSPPSSAYRVVPIADCNTLIGTCEPGGCLHEDICVWTAR